MTIHPKVVGASAGVGVGGAIATLAVWGLSAHGVHPPDGVEQALGTIFDFSMALVFGWCTPAAANPPKP